MRNAKIKKRVVEADPVYNSKAVAKIINNIMMDGKKTVAQGIIYDTFDILSEKGGSDALTVFDKALQNVGPKTEIKARRVGGANYQIPIEVKGERRNALAIRWIIEAARAKSNSEFHTFAEKLAAEILAAANNEGEAIKKRDNVHRMAEANKAFAHFSR
ncbi:30S ribosomal protein S7 [Candidatus Dojkabacteria bacterium]|uniref:Small ribosomal subunit protein uS7 n=1 Tax=Candidatus Dojkabacteria bacterium TaxID=2099670 RepID=A0A5C7JAR9_9BACT|nr:MAG: 30S ribosomal protein S7 [Candidatus Dojkabacteria bacterium]